MKSPEGQKTTLLAFLEDLGLGRDLGSAPGKGGLMEQSRDKIEHEFYILVVRVGDRCQQRWKCEDTGPGASVTWPKPHGCLRCALRLWNVMAHHV